MYKILHPSDISTRKFKVYKNWAFDNTTVNNYGIYVQEGISGSGVFNSQSDATNSYDESFKRLVWSSIQHLYYPTTSLNQQLHPLAYTRNFIDLDKINLVTRSLEDTGIGVINIPVKIFGEEIKPGTFLLETSSIKIVDDGNYNIYVSGTSPRTVVGNIFYQHGHIIITSESYTSSLNVFDLSFQSTHEIYENEIYCNVLESEYNYSTNPSSYDSNSIDYIGIFSSSLIQPYITTIGLYNNDNELLVVAKLPRPYRQSDVLDTTFLIRYDT